MNIKTHQKNKKIGIKHNTVGEMIIYFKEILLLLKK